MKALLRKSYTTFSFLIDLLLPPRKTERAIRLLTIDTLQARAVTSDSGTQVLPYHDTAVRALVWELKYRRNERALGLAGQFLSEQALGIAEDLLDTPVLVPVPMHASRRSDRGYNQCELLCEAMLAASPGSFMYAPRALERVRNTPQQQGLAKHRRVKNIQGAMRVVHLEAIQGKTCIVVDDVRTTGATADETRRALMAGGAKEAYILTLAQS
jgi:ComF family protein